MCNEDPSPTLNLNLNLSLSRSSRQSRVSREAI